MNRIKKSLSVFLVVCIFTFSILPNIAFQPMVYANGINPQERLINGCEDIDSWSVSDPSDLGTVTKEAVQDIKDEGTGAVKVTYNVQKTEAGFLDFVWKPSPELDLSNAKELQFDVYPLSQTSGEGEPVAVNISNSGTIVYMGGIPRLTANQWNTVTIDLSDKQRNAISEIKFWTYCIGFPSEGRNTVSYVIDNMRVVENNPVASVKATPGAGAVINGTKVTLSTDTAGAAIYYTTDGSDPKTSDTKNLYTEPITITDATNIKAYASASAMTDSDNADFSYTIDTTRKERLINSCEDIDSWSVSDPGDLGTVTKEAVQDIKDEGTGAVKVTYNVQKTEAGVLDFVWKPSPEVDLSKATELKFDVYPLSQTSGEGEPVAVNISNSGTIVYMRGIPKLNANQWNTVTIDLSDKQRNAISEIKFWTYCLDYPSEGRNMVSYVIDNMRVVEDNHAASVKASPEGGTVINGTQVTLSTDTAGAAIYYTTDGSDPKTSDTKNLYTEPITITDATNIKAYASASAMADSDTVVFSYTIDTTRKERLINGCEDIGSWTVSDPSELGTVTKEVVQDIKDEGIGAVKVTYNVQKAEAGFLDFVWEPSPELDLSNATELQFDVYPLSQTSGEGEPVAVNISNSGTIVYMGGIPRLTANQWNTVTIDLSDKQRNAISEIKFWTYCIGFPSEGRNTVSYVIDNMRVVEREQVSQVMATPDGGTVTNGTSVTLSTNTTGASIYYTTDGSDPKTSATKNLYTEPIAITDATIVKAYAVLQNMTDSNVSMYNYTLGTGTDGENLLNLNRLGQESYIPVLPNNNIAIDGNLDDWGNYTGIQLPGNNSRSSNLNDLSCKANFAYDENNLYIGIKVIDDIHNGKYGFGMYGGDCVQLAFSDRGVTYGPEYGLSNVDGRPEIWRWFNGSAKLGKESVQLNTKHSVGLTTYEAAIPWKAIFQEKPEKSLKMTLQVNDNDLSEAGGNLVWKPGISNPKSASQFAELQLVNAGQAWNSKLISESDNSDYRNLALYISNFSNSSRTFKINLQELGINDETVEIPAGKVLKKKISVKASEVDGKTITGLLTDLKSGETQVCEWSSDTDVNPLSQEEIDVRNAELAKRIQNAAVIETEKLKFSIDKNNGNFDLIDKKTGIRWASNPYSNGFAVVELKDANSQLKDVVIDSFKTVEKNSNGELELVASPQIEGQNTGVLLNFKIKQISSPDGLNFSYTAEETGGWKVNSIKLLDKAFWTTDADNGYAVVPSGVGKMLPADRGLPYTLSYPTYGDYQMAFVGMVKNNTALLINWTDPYTALQVEHKAVDLQNVGGADMVVPSLVMSKSSNNFNIRVLGEGNYVDIAKAYRTVAEERGLLSTFKAKKLTYSSTEKLYGAAAFKLDTSVRGGGVQYNSHTFEETGLFADHWKNVLRIDRALVTLGGWINKGFDNQYPDILPAAPEPGGNAGLQSAADIIKGNGYLFGLHDNYQDMYEDAPSFDEKYLMYGPDGRPQLGGVWAGGQAYLTAADKGLFFAERNLPEVKKLFNPTSYFIDTTFNVPLNESYAPNPLTMLDDMKYKSQLADYAKEQFGVFGSEGGVEWAVPHGDYFEALLGSKTQSNPNDHVIPLFELVYGDCVNLYTHMSDKLGKLGTNAAKATLGHILYAENALYDIPDGLYFNEDASLPLKPGIPEIEKKGEGRYSITYKWEALEDINKDCQTVFTHLTYPTSEGQEAAIAFQEGHGLVTSTKTWKKGDIIEDGPHEFNIPAGMQGSFGIRTMIVDGGTRQKLQGNDDGYRRYLVGYLSVDEDGNIQYQEAPLSEQKNNDVFSRADNGWAEDLGPYDRQLKNTYEILSYLNRLTAETPMTNHKYLTEDETVEKTTFGDVEIVVNYGNGPYSYQDTILPQYGFVVKSPGFVAFYANIYNGIDYPDGALFTIRSIDGMPLWQSDKIRIYHGFGTSKIALDNNVYDIKKEAIIENNSGGDTGNSSSDSSNSGSTGSSIKDSTIVPITQLTGNTAVSSVTKDELQKAFENAGDTNTEVGKIRISIKEVMGAQEYVQNLPAEVLKSDTPNKVIEIETPLGTVSVSDNMLRQKEAENAGQVGISVKKANTSFLSDKITQQIGTKPAIELRILIDGKEINWQNDDAPVIVSMPYMPSEEELKNSEHILAWQIGDNGNALPIANAKYDVTSGKVVFRTDNSGRYSVAFVMKTFKDIQGSYAQKSIEILASKGIIGGTSKDAYSPEKTITRGDFIKLLVDTLDLKAKFDVNFTDIDSSAYYYSQVGTAKELGIIEGMENDKFQPTSFISREDMMVMTARAIKLLNKNITETDEKILSRYSDASQIEAYAKESMAYLVDEGIIVGNGKKLLPKEKVTRAQAAVILYKIYNQYLNICKEELY